MKRILFTGGGSAGHVIPNIALIEELLSNGGADVCYMGTNGIEKRLIAAWKIPYYEIECPKLIRGGGWQAFKSNLHIPFDFLKAQKQALEGLRLLKPDVVFSKGGYVALPVIWAARKLKIPCFAHESDFSPGLANKLSARKCRTIFTSFPETAKRLPHGKYSGAPLRRSLLNATKAEARLRLSIPFSEKVLLVFGGGSGSTVINTALRNQLKALTEKYTILHVCGKGNLIECNLPKYRQYEFITDMGMAYACADLIISRAGAGTVFEILALKKPSLLIPLEGQTRGDQAENALYFEKHGLCHVLPQERLNTLAEEIDKAFMDNDMKKRLLEHGFTSGNGVILRELYQLLEI